MKIILYIYLFMGFTWFGYLAMMHLKHNQEHIGFAVKFFGYPWAAFYYLIDVIFNIIVGTILFVEIPQEFLFTARVSRHIKGEGWKKKLAVFFCEKLLNPFDPSGKHCK